MQVFKNLSVIILGLVFGLSLGFLLTNIIQKPSSKNPVSTTVSTSKKTNKEVLGFLPYWLLSSASENYAGKITNLDYFSLTPDTDGSILKFTMPGESEPGYLALTSGKLDPFFDNARQNNIKLSLTIFDGDQDSINELISDPVNHADNLVNDLTPIISQYGFSDLNMDIEGTDTASPSAQLNYQLFIKEIHDQIKSKIPSLTLSDDIIPVDLVRDDHLSVPKNIINYLDYIVVMAYDFHSPSSLVTGPVAPLYGAGSESEFDTQSAINAASKLIDPKNILLGMPFYGYSWETIDNFPRSAVIPTTAFIEDNKDLENLLSNCATCSAQFDNVAQESYLIYKNTDSNTFQQYFYPDMKSVSSKINFIKGNNLGGLAIWALGYENQSGNIFNPIEELLKE
ncbi:MAG TPA: glycoside hydrolase family 18 protein [Patescibacteria group bacterium]|nr:glycoside hydrolase family 18 protein [Patescibacteria group bacterium]